MTTSPQRIIDLITFCEQHTTPFSSNAADIGLLPSQANAYADATNAAREAFNAAAAARAASEAATRAQTEAVRTLRNLNGDLIRIIRGFAGQAPDPNKVYALSELSPPAPPKPLAPPGTPTDFTVALNADGSIKLKWKCKNPSGTNGVVYSLRRRTGTAPYMYLGATGTKNYTDATIPVGTAAVTYEVQAQRSGSRGQPSQFTVQFGVAGDGAAMATVVTPDAQPLKIAA
jgi:hypothetical protein